MDYIEDVGPETYEIKKIILADGTEFDINKITGFTIVKESQIGNQINWKMTYCAKSKDDLLSLSNQCCMASYAFKLMRERKIDFDSACKMYDEILENARKKVK